MEWWAREEKERTFSDLQEVEARRRDALKRSEMNPFRVLLFRDGAALIQTLFDPVLLTTFITYAILRPLAVLTSAAEEIEIMQHAHFGLFGALLNFFQIVYLSMNYSRFNDRYGKSMICIARIFDTASLARAHLDVQMARRLIRYMNACHIAGYVGLATGYTTANCFNPFNQKFRLLTEKERKRMDDINMDYGGSAYREIIVWCLKLIETAYKGGEIDLQLAQQFRDKILILRGTMAELYDFADQPLPFFYTYFVCFLQVLYLPLMAASVALGTENESSRVVVEIDAALSVVLVTFFSVGMRVFSQKLSNPYGGDIEDLSVLTYLTDACTFSNQILAAELPEPSNAEIENRLWQERESALGDAFMKRVPRSAWKNLVGEDFRNLGHISEEWSINGR